MGSSKNGCDIRLTCVSPNEQYRFVCQLVTSFHPLGHLETCFTASLFESKNVMLMGTHVWERSFSLGRFDATKTQQDYHLLLRDFVLQCRGDLLFEGFMLQGSYEYEGRLWGVNNDMTDEIVCLPTDMEGRR